MRLFNFFKIQELGCAEKNNSPEALINNTKKKSSSANDYIVFDFETSCRNSKLAEIIEISALKVSSGNVIDHFSSLVKPHRTIDPHSYDVHGISEDMLKNAPTAQEVLASFIKFIGKDLLVGHNIATFDLPILRRYLKELFNKSLNNSYIDTLQMAKERMNSVPNYKLSTIAIYFGIDTTGAHRALTDCYITQQCFEKLSKLPVLDVSDRKSPHKFHTLLSEETKALQELQVFILGIVSDNKLDENEIFSLKKWMETHSDLSGNYPFDRVFSAIESALEDGFLSEQELNDLLSLFKKFTSPLEECKSNSLGINFSEKIVCLTGDFKYGKKSDVENLLISKGALCKSSVTKKTSYVIVGSYGSADWACGNYGTKIKRALELKEQGQDIQILKEDDLCELFTK